MDIRDVPTYIIALPNKDISRTLSELKDFGFSDIRISDGVRHRSRKTGVALAHKAALEKALSECDGPFLILEDDVEMFRSNPEVFIPSDADAIYLGLSTWGLKDGHGVEGMVSYDKFNGGMFRIWNMLAAHAILYLNHDYPKFLLKAIDVFINMGTNQDKMRAETMKYWTIYAQGHPLFAQAGRNNKHTRVKLTEMTHIPLIRFYL